MEHYEELLEQLRNIVNHGDEQPAEYCTNRCGGCDACDKSIDAIETLLAERDALIEQVHGRCLFCANRIKCLCENDIEFRSYCRLNNDCNWQWRGPQKHD